MDNGVFFASINIGAQPAPNMQIGNDLADSTPGAFLALLERSVIGIDSQPSQQENLSIQATLESAPIICEEPLAGNQSLESFIPVLQSLPEGQQASLPNTTTTNALLRQLAQLLRSALPTGQPNTSDMIPMSVENRNDAAEDTDTASGDAAAIQWGGSLLLANLLPINPQPAALPQAVVTDDSLLPLTVSRQNGTAGNALSEMMLAPGMPVVSTGQPKTAEDSPAAVFTNPVPALSAPVMHKSISGFLPIPLTEAIGESSPLSGNTDAVSGQQTALQSTGPDFGSLQVGWSTDQTGHPVAMIQTDHMQVNAFLQEHTAALRQALADAGVPIGTPIQINLTQQSLPVEQGLSWQQAMPMVSGNSGQQGTQSSLIKSPIDHLTADARPMAINMQTPGQQANAAVVSMEAMPASQPAARRKSTDMTFAFDLSRPLGDADKPQAPGFFQVINTMAAGNAFQATPADAMPDTQHPWVPLANGNRHLTSLTLPEVIDHTSQRMSESNSGNFTDSVLSQFTGHPMSSAGHPSQTASVHALEQSKSMALPPQVVIEQITTAMRMNTKGIQRELDVQLDPPELGTVHVRVIAHAGGELIARIQASDPAVRDMLKSHMEQLRQTFADNGFDMEHCTISLDLQAGHRQQHGGEQGQQTWQQGAPLPHLPGDEELMRETPLRVAQHDQSALDYFA